MGDRRYRFGVLERRGVIGGLRWGQLTVIGTGLVGAVVALRLVGPPPIAAATALALAALSAVAGFWPVGGRCADEWIPIVAAWALTPTSRRRWRSPAPTTGRSPGGEVRPVTPPTLEGVSILHAEPPQGGQARVGVVRDARRGTYTGVLSVRGSSFALADAVEKERRLAGWGAVLASFAREGSPVVGLGWVERTIPDDTDEIGRYLATAVTAERSHPSVASYLQVVDDASPVTQDHETLVTLTINTRRAKRQVAQAGGGEVGACVVLVGQLQTLAQRLRGAGLDVHGALTPRLVAQAIRTGFDPATRPGLTRLAAGDPERAGITEAGAWPLAADTTWASYRTDGGWHVTYWVAEWPRVEVGPDFAAPLFLQTTATRTVALAMAPVSPLRAAREAEVARTTDIADEQLRRRAGFITTARRAQAHESVERREQELAVGHTDIRYSGYVTVTAPTPDDLVSACAEVEGIANQSGLELRRLWGEQDVAFTYTLPLGRGVQ